MISIRDVFRTRQISREKEEEQGKVFLTFSMFSLVLQMFSSKLLPDNFLFQRQVAFLLYQRRIRNPVNI